MLHQTRPDDRQTLFLFAKVLFLPNNLLTPIAPLYKLSEANYIPFVG